MSINFEHTTCLRVIQERLRTHIELMTNEDADDIDIRIYERCTYNKAFSCLDVDFKEFHEYYTEESWIGRKIIALPQALWGVIKTIYHLAMTIIAIPIVVVDEGKYLNKQLYTLIADGWESYGRLNLLINDEWGQFHVQASQFKRKCFDCLAHRGKYNTLISSEARKMSLYDYKQKTAEERENLIKRFNLNQISLKLPGSNKSLNTFVDNADPELLQLLTLEDLIIPFSYSKLKVALMDEKKINTLRIKDIDGIIDQGGRTIFKQKLSKLFENSTQESTFNARSNFCDIRLSDVARMNVNDINKHKNEIPHWVFSFFRNDQIKGLKLSELKATQNKALFYACNEIEAKERLALFDDQDIVNAIHTQMLSVNIINYLTCQQIKLLELTKFTIPQTIVLFSRLKLSRLDWDTIKHLFPSCEGSSSRGFDRSRFAEINANEVQTALENLNKPALLYLLSDNQFQHIDFSKTSPKVMSLIFPSCSFEGFMKEQFGITGSYQEIWLKLSEEIQKRIQKLATGQKKINRFYWSKLLPEQQRCLHSRDYCKEFSVGEKPKLDENADDNKSSKSNIDTYCAILGVPPGASNSEIKNAYHSLSLKYHPDKHTKRANESETDYGIRKKEYEAKIREINSAYEELCKT